MELFTNINQVLEKTCSSYLSSKIQKGFEEGNITSIILIDLQNAFDIIGHEILLLKMNYLAFAGSTINWFRFYLVDRTFMVHVVSLWDLF